MTDGAQEQAHGEGENGPDAALDRIPRLSTLEKRTFDLQEAFLAARSASIADLAACELVGITDRAVRYWKSGDVLGFRARYEEAHKRFCDRLEQKAMELAFGLSPGQNAVILITLLNGNMPEKYRPNVIATDESAKELAQELRRQRREWKASEEPAREADPEGRALTEEASAVRQAEAMLRKRMGGDG